MEHRTLYDDGAYRLDVELRSTDRRVVVFFPHRFATGDGLRRNYGADFASRYGMNAMIVGSQTPDWFQGASFPRLLSALERLCGCFDHVTFTGSSMGGYGAIAAASQISVDHVIAFSPVSNIDPSAYPADLRYEDDFARIGRFDVVTRHLARRYSVIYDPADLDRRHLGNFGIPEDKLLTLQVPGAGHVTQRVLKEAGLLSQWTRALLNEEVPSADDIEALRRARRETPSWLLNMFNLNLARRPEVAEWALERLKETGAWSHRYGRFNRRLRRAKIARRATAA